MEVISILWFFGLVAFVCCYTPTFRNEATHPLKAPTESTLGLQMADESVSQTKSNRAPKEEPYAPGGEHFEYIFLNNSNIVLTSLQNDNPIDVGAVRITPNSSLNLQTTSQNDSSADVSAPQQTVTSFNKDDSSTKSSFLNYDAPIATPSSKSLSNDLFAYPNEIRRLEYPRTSKDSWRPVILGYPQKMSEDTIKKDEKLSKNSSSKVNNVKRNSLGFEKGPNISSTTKLYSKHANKSAESFASFTSPLAEKSMYNIYNDNDELVAAPPASNPQRSPNLMKTSNSQGQNYDYDDPFTKILFLNGILKPDPNKSRPIEPTTENVSPFKGILHNENTKDTNPSAEDISRIMDGSVIGFVHNNGTDASSSINQSVEGSYSKPIMKQSPAEPNLTDSSSHQLSISTSTSTSDKSIATNTISTTTSTSDKSIATNTMATTTNLFPAKLQMNRMQPFINSTPVTSGAPDSINPATISPPIHVEQLITSTMLVLTNSTSMPDAATSTSASADIPTPMPTKVHPKRNSIPEKHVSLSGAQFASAEFVHTDQSNENPLTAKAYTDLVSSSVESETENSLASKQKAEDATTLHRADINDDAPPRIITMNHDRFLALNQLLAAGVYQPAPATASHYRPSYLRKRVLSVSEFKELIEESVRHLFYFVARSLREQNLLGRNVLLENSSSQNQVTLKRFGFVSIVEAFRQTNVDFDRYDVSEWTDIADGSYKKVDIHLNRLFDDQDTENVRWIVLATAKGDIFSGLQSGLISSVDSVLGARVSLEYCELKINAVIAMPQSVVTNITLPESEESSIDVNEVLELVEPTEPATNTWLEMGAERYRVLQLFSRYSQAWTNAQEVKMRRSHFKYQHEDVEFYIFVLGGAICVFSMLSPLLYAVYKFVQNRRLYSNNSISDFRFKLPSIFTRSKFQYQESHEKMPESRCESLTVIFSEEFDKKYSSWFDNTHHTSSIQQRGDGGGAVGAGLLNDDTLDEYPEFSDLTRNVCESNSPRLSRENRLNMGCRPACMLLPHPATYLIRSEKDERYFDNPNYSR